MKVYTYSQARQKLARLLDDARNDGSARIKRRDGQVFQITPVTEEVSPMDVPGIITDLTLDELNSVIRESRERD